MKFNIGDKVYVMDEKTLSGQIYAGPIDCPEKKTPSFLIKLRKGFWNPERTCFVSVLAVDESSIRLVPKRDYEYS